MELRKSRPSCGSPGHDRPKNAAPARLAEVAEVSIASDTAGADQEVGPAG
jgi:hypothetical protein